MPAMSTVTEIEAAITRLPVAKNELSLACGGPNE
jgi:hypothetical protein